MNDLYLKTVVPFPKNRLVIAETDNIQMACKKIDVYFEDVIRNYSRNTQKLLRDMYYNNKNVRPKKNLIKDKSYQANWSVSYANKRLEYFMTVDEDSMASPLTHKRNKIHEIAGHIGQIADRAEKLGAKKVFDELDGDKLRVFLERSVTFMEKELIDAIPQKLMKESISLIKDASCRETIEKNHSYVSNMSKRDFTNMRHRHEDVYIYKNEDYALILKNPYLKDYDAYISGRPIEIPKPKSVKELLMQKIQRG